MLLIFNPFLIQSRNKKYYFRPLDITNGLSQNTVYAILQDKYGFMWFGTQDGLNRYSGLSMQTFMKNDLSENNTIAALYEDKNGNIWIGTDAGIFTYNPDHEKISCFVLSTEKGEMIQHRVTQIGSDGENIWFSVLEEGLYCYKPEQRALTLPFPRRDNRIPNDITQFLLNERGTHWFALYADNLYYTHNLTEPDSLKPFICIDGRQPFKGDIINKMVKGKYNKLYIGSANGGLNEVNLTTREVKEILTVDDSGNKIYVREIMFYSDNELWIGSESGIFIYNTQSGNITHLRNISGDSYTINDNAIYSLYKDREEGLWIGSYFGGLNYYPKQDTYFEKIYPHRGQEYIGKRVRELCADDKGYLWIGTEDNGLMKYNLSTKQLQQFTHPNIYKNVHGLCYDGKYLWAGTFSGGLNRINLHTNEVKTYRKGNTSKDITSDYVFSICYTSSKELWIGTTSGVVRYNYETDTFSQFHGLRNMFIYDIKEDADGNIWFANYTNGLYKLDVRSKNLIHFQHNTTDNNSLPSNRILSIFEDSKKQIWITTHGGGFARFDASSNNFIRYNHSMGLPSDVVHQVIEDNNGLLWITTNDGLVRLDPSTNKIKRYSVADGLLSNQFNNKSSYKDKYGHIYLGSINGLVFFDPSTFKTNMFVPPVVITDFFIFNQKVVVGAKGSPLTQSISVAKEIELESNENSLSFSVAVLSYKAPEINTIIYQLEGFDKDWQTANKGKISYSNLAPGNYILKVKGANNDGVWNDSMCTLKIRIHPPFYYSTWAYITYTLLILIVVICTYIYLKRRTAEKHRLKMEQFEHEKERELYQSKIDFFTNVTHEIRTPLTLIKSPLENILQMSDVNKSIREDLLIMDRNASRLLNLTNQLLDFRKIEGSLYELTFTQADMEETLKGIFMGFTSLAKQKGLDFKFSSDCDKFQAMIDVEALTKIVSNLLNNAIKFAKTYTLLSLQRDEKHFAVTVCNDGQIIPLEKREEIFYPFIQYHKGSNVQSGTGIGLALARSLAELHQGQLNMDADTECNRFILLMPYLHNEPSHAETDTNLVVHSELEEQDLTLNQETNKSKTAILLVDDDLDIIAYLQKYLSPMYLTYTANDGCQAIKILAAESINIIVSDVMMPNMNGLELCNYIKSDINYSHIPIILLTAKTTIQSKIEGLRFGADSYIEKPFSLDLLKVNINNLLENRAKMLQAFSCSPLATLNIISSTQADEDFMKQLSEVINKNIQDSNFSLDQMATELGMSRSSLNRKIKGLLDLTPNDYIRIERLKRAAFLLKEQGCRVNEVCYMVGFSTPSYFTKCFREQFGMLPKEFISPKE